MRMRVLGRCALRRVREVSNPRFVREVSNASDDPDIYRGPGGLTARQIFEKIQQGKEKDNLKTPENNPGDDIPNVNDLSIRELQEALQQKGIDYSDCIEKVELVERYRANF